tara:strand:- start:1462 stop:1743 length:282 start_codon:yes stop_codon:yes gene_type:complete
LNSYIDAEGIELIIEVDYLEAVYPWNPINNSISDDEHEIGLDDLERKDIRLLKMMDVLAREYKEHKKGRLLFYVYETGDLKNVCCFNSKYADY